MKTKQKTTRLQSMNAIKFDKQLFYVSECICYFTMTPKILAGSLVNFLLSISGQTYKFIIYAIMTRYCSRQIEVSGIFVSFSSRVLT